MQILYSRKGLLITTAVAFHYVKICLTSYQALEKSLFPKVTPLPDEEGAAAVIQDVIRTFPPCSYAIFSDNRNLEYKNLLTILNNNIESQGILIVRPHQERYQNSSQPLQYIMDVRKVRQSFSCVTMVVVSNNFRFLEKFAAQSLKDRLLSASTRIIVVSGSLTERALIPLTRHWAYSMNKAMVAIPGETQDFTRWDLFTVLPFSDSGRRLVQTASWFSSVGLVRRKGRQLFPPKFLNFHKNDVSVASLTYKPYFEEIKGPNGTVVYSGADGRLLEAMASSLNFTISMYPINNWHEALERVNERVAFICPAFHAVLPLRLKLVDFTRTYEHGMGLAFAMVKPKILPQWQSLYYPLSNQVWLMILCVLLISPVFFRKVYNRRHSLHIRQHYNLQDGDPAIVNMLSIFGMLLGQSLSREVSPVASSRVLLFMWIVFAFIIGTAYKGNLIAFIVAPSIPPKVDTVEELAGACDKLFMASYGAAQADVLKNSENEAFRKLGNVAELGVGPVEGLKRALNDRSVAYGNLPRFLNQKIAEHFTEVDGTTKLYVGRDILLPSINAWPIPHDAPYKENLDSVISAVIEHGLYDKWMDDMLYHTKKMAQRKRLQDLKEENENLPIGETIEEALRQVGKDDDDSKPLTIVHLQGIFMIWGVGVGLGVLSLVCESGIHKVFPHK